MSRDEEQKQSARFELLHQLTLSAIEGERLGGSANSALVQTTTLLGLSAAAIFVWGEDGAVRLSASHAEESKSESRLRQLEEGLFQQLRKDRQLVTAFMSFGGAEPYQSFTIALRHKDRVFGAVIGLQSGTRRLLDENLFLETLSASLSLYAMVDQLAEASPISTDQIEKERLGAITETAVAVNHEINNPLTAILGNVQLLLLKRNNLDPELEGKLRTIETSALKIRDVTQRLLQLTSARSVRYAEGTSMIDLSGKGEEG